MKKLLTLLLASIITVTSFDAGALNTAYVRSIPIVLTSLEAAAADIFWAAMIAAGAVKISQAMAEPLDKYKCGVQYSHQIAVSGQTWPDGDYYPRTVTVDRTYSYDPVRNVASWWTKRTFQQFLPGGVETDITYDQSPPALVQFDRMDVKYRRYALAGSHTYSFSYDASEVITCYCIRLGSSAWGRPVMAIMSGWVWVAIFRSDVLFHSPIRPYTDYHWTFIGPGSQVLYKPHDELQTEFTDPGAVTTAFNPND